MISLEIQFHLFLFSLFIGIYLGATYDVIHYFILIHVKKTTKMILDIAFFAIQGVIVFNVIYNLSYGIIPVYCYFLIFIGLFLYSFYLRNQHLVNLKPIKKVLIKAKSKLLKLLYFLCVDPLINVYKVGRYFIMVFLKLFKKLKKRVNKIRNDIKRKKTAKKKKKLQKITSS